MSVSVVVPAFNAEKYLAETLDSIIGQTQQPEEVIIVDDASTDKTRQVIERYFKKLPIVLISQAQNGGIGKARFVGAKAAYGDYIAYLSSDDVYAATFIEKSLPFLDKNTASYTSYYRCNSNLESQTVFKPPQFSRESVVAWALKKNMYVNFSSVILPRQIFEKVEFESALRHSEDLIFLLDSVIAGLNYRLVDEPLLYYRIHNLAGTVTQKPEEFETCWHYLTSRLSALGLTDEQIKQAHKVSFSRAFPSLQRRLASKTYHFFVDRLLEVKA